jgi:hypothetical protein
LTGDHDHSTIFACRLIDLDALETNLGAFRRTFPYTVVDA